MAPTEGRVARPERRWGCRRGTPNWTQSNQWTWTDSDHKDRYHLLVPGTRSSWVGCIAVQPHWSGVELVLRVESTLSTPTQCRSRTRNNASTAASHITIHGLFCMAAYSYLSAYAN